MTTRAPRQGDIVTFVAGPLLGKLGTLETKEEPHVVRLHEGGLVQKVRLAHISLVASGPEPWKDREPAPSESDLTKIIDRIRKLHAKAVSARDIGSEAEATTFAEAVQKMLTKYKLEMSEVELAAQEKDEPVGEEWVDFRHYGAKERRQRLAWSERLAAAVARAHFCQIIVSSNTNSVAFVGRPTDRKIAEYVFVTLYRFADKTAKQEYGAARRRLRREGRYLTDATGFMSSWKHAFALRITERYREEEDRYRRELKKLPTGTGLVRLDQAHAVVRQYIDDMIRKGQLGTKSRGPKSRGYANDLGMAAGRAAGDRANIRGTGLEGGSTGGGPKRLGA